MSGNKTSRSQQLESMLAVGARNSLGRTEEVVRIVLHNRRRLPELFNALRSDDEWIRMRAGDALEKVCRERPEWFVPYFDRLVGEVAAIEQPSVQWHVAQMLGKMRLSPEHYRRSKQVLKRNFEHSRDWIVLNVTMEQLFDWAAEDPALRRWLKPRLRNLTEDPRNSVRKRATKLLAALDGH